MNILYGILASIGVLVVTLATIIFYTYVRMRNAHTKFKIEAGFILIVLLISIGFKVAVILTAKQTTVQSISSFFDAIYKAIGGLTFEGVSPADESSVAAWKMVCYYGTSLYAGLVTLFIVSVKASYELYSKIYLSWFRKRNIYIITDISDETLALAKNIRKKDIKGLIVFAGPRLSAFDRHNELCLQVMANGFLYWSYSRKAKRYIENRKKGNKGQNDAGVREESITTISEDKSIAARLGTWWSFGGRGIFYNNIRLRKDGTCYDEPAKKSGKRKKVVSQKETGENGEKKAINHIKKRIFVFAFAASNHIPMEAENIKTVCDDVRTRIAHPDKLCIEYVLLTKDGIEYAAYDVLYNELFEEFKNRYAKLNNITFEKANDNDSQEVKDAIKKENERKIQEIKKIFYSQFVINCWCESDVIGKQAYERMLKCGFAEDIAGNCEPLYIWTLGFGSRGKAVTQELFVQSANIDDKGEPRKCLIDVFDSQADAVGGLYKFTHPSFKYIMDGEETGSDARLDYALVKQMCKDLQKEKGKSSDYVADVEAACNKHIEAIGIPLVGKADGSENSSTRGIPRPVFRFHSVSCDDNKFFETIDRETGIDRSRTRDLIKEAYTFCQNNAQYSRLENLLHTPYAPKAIIVATGDDEQNLRIANALIQDIIFEAEKEKKLQGNVPGAKKDKKNDDKEKQYIIVNITDSSNNVRLIRGQGKWCEETGTLEFGFGLNVIVVGNFKTVYTYDNVVGQSQESAYNYMYEQMNGILSLMGKPFEKLTEEELKIVGQEGEWATMQTHLEYAKNYIVGAYDAPPNAESEERKNGHLFVKYMVESSSKNFRFMKRYFNALTATGEVPKTVLICDKSESDAGTVSDNPDILRGAIQTIFVNVLKDPHVLALENGSGMAGKCTREVYTGTFATNAIIKYSRRSIWERRSNQSAAEFSPVLAAIYKTDSENYSHLAAIEHDRWVRLHLAYGWNYGTSTKKPSRLHKCIQPYAGLKEYAMFDLINVIWAVCDADNNSSE